VRVWLIPEHQRGPAGDAVLLDAAGEPFAADGDRVLATGGDRAPTAKPIAQICAPKRAALSCPGRRAERRFQRRSVEP
jgi:hypothetical protein